LFGNALFYRVARHDKSSQSGENKTCDEEKGKPYQQTVFFKHVFHGLETEREVSCMIIL